jgi:hypothetical protein
MTPPAASSGAERRRHRPATGRVFGRENRIEMIGAYSENKLVWMELTGAAHGVFALGSGLRMRPRFP